MNATAQRVVACRACRGLFVPAQPWHHTCPSCFRPRPVAAKPDQLSLTDTIEWAEATAPNVVRLRPRSVR